MNSHGGDTPKTNLNSVGMHDAFWRDGDLRDKDTIQYPKLDEHVGEADTKEYPLLNSFWGSPEGSVDELRYARRAAEAYLIRTAALLRTGDDEQKQLVSDRFTQASIEMYGQPDKAEAAKLAAIQLVELKSLQGSDNVDQDRLKHQIEYFEKQIGFVDSASVESADISEVLSQVGEVIERRYGNVLQIFDNLPAGKMSADNVRELFQRAIGMLTETEPAWRDWLAKTTKGGAMSADIPHQTVGVGNIERETSRLKGSFIHEVIAHALQGVNGHKSGDPDLEAGLPNSKDAIDGVAVFLSACNRGAITDRPKDFYMDVAFALGQFGQPKISRSDLQKLYLDRSIIRKQANGKKVNRQALEAKSWSYVNRIYRGTLGNEIVGVNTFDICYYKGFIMITRIAEEMLVQGKTADEVFDYLTLGRFDPSNPMHIDHVDRVLAKKQAEERG